MSSVWLYSLISVFLVSCISLIGVFSISIKEDKLRAILIYFISFSAGALFGDTFIHLLPEAARETGFSTQTAIFVLTGIVVSFMVEKFICWRHCHLPITKQHVHRFAYMNLFGDSVHNFIDGMILGGSFLVSVPIGIATTVAIILHEIPQEIGDFGVLLHGGFSRGRAIFFNFLTALTAVLGAVFSLVLSVYIKDANSFLIPFAAGSFIYIAGSDLIPELHKEVRTKENAFQILAFAGGIGIMLLLLVIG